MQLYRRYIKRAFDITSAGCGLIILSPILLAVTVWLTFANKGAGAFFTQDRPGKNRKIFRLIKFKTMTDEKDADGNLLPDADRLTKVGKFVRSTSIDELPQLWNVLKGDMSLIGPRPLLVRYLPYYTEIENHRHDVRPGITGLAQVCGRNNLSWDEKLQFDVKYVSSISFIADLKIIIRTIANVVSKKDITVPKGLFLDDERSKKNTITSAQRD